MAEKAAEEAAKKEEGIKQQDKADSQGKENTPADQGWYQFETMLRYKMDWIKAELIEIGRFDPSSKMCSKCGNMKHDLKLSDRIYHCNTCGLTIDRDLNAAINILHMGLIKVGKNVGRGAPEFTPVESATAAELSKGGLRVATL